MSSSEQHVNAKIIVALRAARAAIGWSQEEFSKKLGVAKSTVARVETLEMAPRGDYVVRAMQLFREAGIEIDLYVENSIPMAIGQKAINEAIQRLDDPSRRRVDRSESTTFRMGSVSDKSPSRVVVGQKPDNK